uniref:Uncharacterized protein n=1 Tax=Macaca fascicularis TaxID=9541 RepID=Q9GMJ7_MACFA|nr:hypothetical protein [Macaca fascicularis]
MVVVSTFPPMSGIFLSWKSQERDPCFCKSAIKLCSMGFSVNCPLEFTLLISKFVFYIYIFFRFYFFCFFLFLFLLH